MLIACSAAPASAAATKYTFYTLDNPADPNFNQLLGINTASIMSGYDGDGSVKPNKGYVLVPTNHYASENFPGSAQTQVVGISNDVIPTTIGFWVDGKGNNFGFLDAGTFTTVAFPNTPASGGVKVNQLLGVNDVPVAVGFYLDANGNSHGYIYTASSKTYSTISLPFKNVVSFQAAGITDANVICGSYTDKTTTHGFYGKVGHFVSVDAAGAAATAFFGCNNTGFLAGAITTAKGVSNGVIYDTANKTSQIVNDPNQSATAAFGVSGTFINGINSSNEVVGFYSDGKKVHGFWARPTAN